MKRCGEDIIITQTGEMQQAKTLASHVSKSPNHACCHLWYIDSKSKQLARATYFEGRLYTVTLTNPKLQMGNWWFSCGKKRGLTIIDAIARYGQGWVKAQAERLGGTGRYSTIC